MGQWGGEQMKTSWSTDCTGSWAQLCCVTDGSYIKFPRFFYKGVVRKKDSMVGIIKSWSKSVPRLLRMSDLHECSVKCNTTMLTQTCMWGIGLSKIFPMLLYFENVALQGFKLSLFSNTSFLLVYVNICVSPVMSHCPVHFFLLYVVFWLVGWFVDLS